MVSIRAQTTCKITEARAGAGQGRVKTTLTIQHTSLRLVFLPMAANVALTSADKSHRAVKIKLPKKKTHLTGKRGKKQEEAKGRRRSVRQQQQTHVSRCT